MKRIYAGVLASVLACGCTPAPTAPTAPVDEPPRAGPTTIHLDRAESFEVLAVAQALLQEPVYVEASALASLRCATVTLNEPNPIAPRIGAEKLLAALRAQGFRIEHGSAARTGWTVSVDDARPPRACAGGRATAASETNAGPAVANADAVAADPKALADEVLRSIREISPTEHAITQHGLDVFLENQPVLMQSLRIVPETTPGGKGTIAGIRIFGVRPDSIMGRIGLENGDRIERVMGKPVATPDQALEAYAAMRSTKTIEIEINRRGAPKKVVVRVE